MNYLTAEPTTAIIIFAVLFLCILIALLLVLSTENLLYKWRVFLKRERREEETEVKTTAYEKADEIMEEARKEALLIIETSNKKAQKVLLEAEEVSEESKESLENKMNEVSAKQWQELAQSTSEMVGAFKDLIERQKRENVDSLTDASEELRQQVLAEVEEFKTKLETETLKSQKIVEDKINAKYSQIETSLGVYKREKLKEIDEKVYDVLAEATKDILGKSLSVEEHRDLVVAALERAKIYGGFTANAPGRLDKKA
ncbi:MAG: Ribonuclease Y [candidate division WWE3 bacterium GW2011_GWA1_46_21]|uniref:Ribonuclease Y n=3 Tax=Katanobacteria TaxID=422282 RepID=A0A0G1PCY5_UNCKA|nr:MAG: Ribonuclease Y [candidate division WWE3 bacterium GW2011_GWA1_46_21]KKU48840.1 MAG: Ribonuclease Y [candidate division WWE3 bacterium GW2011_GWA2_46_9]KKU57296.1 MAG: Ribonuclease Y [candidate division WWE3 bacterium GW2011_GWB1_47_11]